MKKAQVTLFIIIGLVVLVVFGLGMLLLRDDTTIIDPGTGQAKIEIFVSSCLMDVATNGVILVGAQGGYINLTENYFRMSELDTAYGYNTGHDVLATIEVMENELENYIDAGILQCVGNFTGFSEDVEYDDPISDVTIGPDSVFVELLFPVSIDNSRLDKFYRTVELPLGRFHSIAADIVGHIDPDWVDLSYLSRLSVAVNIVPYNDTVVYYLSDDDYLFSFAAKDTLNQPPVLVVPVMITVPDGEPWLYKINCTDPDGDPVEITDDTSMLETLPDGSMLSTPEIPGRYDVTFTCSDNHYNRISVAMVIIVE